MQFNVAEIIARAGTTRQPELVLAPLFPPMGLERDVLAIYMRVVKGWAAGARDTIMPAYSKALSAALRDSPDDVQQSLDDVSADLTRLVIDLGPELEDWVVRVENWHRAAFSRSFTPTGVKLDTLLGAGDVKTTLQSVLADNTALVRSLNDQLRNQISGAVFRGLTNRTTAADVAREIRERVGVGRTRAQLIAADQLQKLTSRLDQERQEQIGIKEFEWVHSRKKNPREIHVARNGKRYSWDSSIAKSDPPGRAIRCGCRARPVVKLAEEAVEPTGVAEPVATPAPPPRAPRRAAVPAPAPPPAPPPPPPPPRGYQNVVNPALTNQTLEVRPRLGLAKALTEEFKQAAADRRYIDTPDNNWSGRTAADYEGRAQFTAAWSDEGASAVAAVKPELDKLAEQIGIPKVRGLKTINSRANANMGGGVMGVNPTEFNARAAARAGVGAAEELSETLRGQAAAVMAEKYELKLKIDALSDRMRRAEYGSNEYRTAQYERMGLVKKWEALDRKRRKLQENAQRTGRQAVAPKSTWQRGDDIKARPWSVALYYDEGIDRIRSTLFHEFAHHVHQQYKREGSGRFIRRPIETRLRELWTGPEGRDRMTRQASQYATTNQFEWFAENFSLFVMGKRELVDPVILPLIEDIFNGRI